MTRFIFVAVIAAALIGFGGYIANGTEDVESAGIERIVMVEQVIPAYPSTCASDHSYFGHADNGYFHQHWTVTSSGRVMVGTYFGSGGLVPGTCRIAW